MASRIEKSVAIPLRRAAPEPVRIVEPKASDAELVGRALGGDRWAEEALYRRHVRRVTDVCTRVLGRTHEADDVVQETFLTALRKLETLREADCFPQWILRIAMNEARMKLRKRRLLRALGLDRGLDDATLESLASREAPSDVIAELGAIDRALAGASADERMAFVLRTVEGLTLPEVADALGCSLATAKRRLASARARLAERFDLALSEPALSEPTLSEPALSEPALPAPVEVEP